MNHMSGFEKSPDPIFARKEISLLDGEWEISIGREQFCRLRTTQKIQRNRAGTN